MRRSVYFLLILIWFWPACTTFKKVQKDKSVEKQEVKTDQKTETNKQVTTNKDTHTVSETTTTEKVDTSVTIPGSTLFGVKLLADILAGNDLKVESENQVLEVFWDSLSNTIKAQATDKTRIVPVRFNRETKKKEFETTKTQSHENTATVDEKQSAKRREVTHESKDVEVKRTYWPFWVGGAVVLAIIIVILVWGRKIYSRFLP